ncbi:MAG: phytanoyl-CoA dioxygenase family protein [Phycisphaeraceae bacterium]|nr:phytanoyl-CoA dioxygenase family protein [Phycisphaeraceae bacterium]
MALTTQQIARYRRDGVLPVGRMLSDLQVQDAREHIQAAMDRQLLDKPGTNPGKFTFRLLSASQSDPWFGQLLRSGPILDAAEAVLGPDIQYFQDNVFYKPARDGDITQWHQDNIWWKSDPPDMLTIWIALDDVTPENGAVRYVVGSHAALIEHRLPVDDPQGAKYNMIHPDDVKDRDVVTFDVPAGHGVMHHCLTIHGAPANVSERPRRGYTVHLMRAGLFPDRLAESNPVLRGRIPTACCDPSPRESSRRMSARKGATNANAARGTMGDKP